MNNIVVPFPKPSPLADTAKLQQLVRDAKERPWRFEPLGGEMELVPEGNKTESIYRWLRVGPPKTLHEMAWPLKSSYPAVLAIINDLRVMGATIVSTKMKRRGRAYKMKGGPRTYAALKRQRKRTTAPA